MSLILHGGVVEADCELKRSEVTHLRLLLAWLRCEYMLDDSSQRGIIDAVKFLVESGHSNEEEGRQILMARADELRHVPHYIQHGIKMLTKLLQAHDARGDTVDGEVMRNRLEGKHD